MRRSPHPRSCFFEQPVLKRQVGDQLLQGCRFRPQFLDFGRRRLTGRVACQPVLARFQELLRTGIIQALGNLLPV